jgi:hypothetical protein
MRRASIMLAVASIVLPFTCAYFATTAFYRDAGSRGVYVCGLPALANFILASLSCAILSAAGFIVGLIAYRRLTTPRPHTRLLEVAILALPFLIVGSYAASFFIAP